MKIKKIKFEDGEIIIKTDIATFWYCLMTGELEYEIILKSDCQRVCAFLENEAHYVDGMLAQCESLVAFSGEME